MSDTERLLTTKPCAILDIKDLLSKCTGRIYLMTMDKCKRDLAVVYLKDYYNSYGEKALFKLYHLKFCDLVEATNAV